MATHTHTHTHTHTRTHHTRHTQGKFFGLLNLAPTTASLVTAIIVGSIYRAVGSYAVIFWGMGALMFVNSIVLFFVNNTTALPKFVTAKSAPKALPPPGSVGRSVY